MVARLRVGLQMVSCILVGGLVTFLGMTISGAGHRSVPSARFHPPQQSQEGKATQPGVRCGEVVAINYISQEGRPFHSYRGQAESEVRYDAIRTGSVASIDLLERRVGTGIQRFLVEQSFGKSRAAKELSPGSLGYERLIVRLQLNMQDEVVGFQSVADSWTGVLTALGPGWIEVLGLETEVSSALGGFFEWWDPNWWRTDENFLPNRKPRKIRVTDGPTVSCFVNRGPVSRGDLLREVGRVVEILPDCAGTARQVDVYKVNDWFNFTGGNRPWDPGPGGAVVFEHPKDADGGKVVRYTTAPAVRFYDDRGVRSRWEGGWEGFVGVWVDPHSKLVTHVFMSGPY